MLPDPKGVTVFKKGWVKDQINPELVRSDHEPIRTHPINLVLVCLLVAVTSKSASVSRAAPSFQRVCV